jgi:hypothetical protein
MNVIPFPNRRAIQTSAKETPASTSLKAYALADLLVAAQVALHVHHDERGFNLLFDVVSKNRLETAVTLAPHVYREVCRYLPDFEGSTDGRLKLYKQIYVR